jgi:hypothetical protein
MIKGFTSARVENQDDSGEPLGRTFYRRERKHASGARAATG